MSRATTSGPVSDSRVFTGYRGKLGADLRHRPVEVDGDGRLAVELDVGQEPGRVGLQLLQEHALGG